jgi:ATP-dependent protease ClpP protease subunit
MNNDFEAELMDKLGSDSIRTITSKKNTHLFFLDEEIGAPSEYRDITQLLLTAPVDEVVNIIINSGGGRLDSTCQIAQAIQAANCSVIATVVGAAYSGASMIACAAHECFILDSAEFMLHTASYGTMGNVPNVKAHTDFVTKQVNRLVDSVYKDFLTAEELVELKAGKEFWLDAADVRKRLSKRQRVQEASYKKASVKDVKQTMKEKL